MAQKIMPSAQSTLSLTKPLTQWREGLIFVIAMWLLSRLVIVVAMQLVAPLYPNPPVHYPPPGHLGFVQGFVPTSGWELFAHWDGAWYRKIATLGYDYANDGQKHSIAFFPLFPLLVRAVMTLGISVEAAGILVNNLAFFGALLLLYRWVEKQHDVKAARWATAVLAWCPFSLFGTAIYTEGLFLLLTTAALRAFDNKQHGWAALWGAMATATRVTGVALIPTFLLIAWREKRPAIAYVAGLAVSGGLLVFSLYCAIQFRDPLAFVHAQRPWQASTGFNWQGWLQIFRDIFNFRLYAVKELTKVVMVFGGGYLLWYLRHQINRAALFYGFFSLALILISGSVMSLNRFAYGIVSLSFGLGILLARHSRWGYGTMGLFAALLVGFSVRFAWWYWVA